MRSLSRPIWLLASVVIVAISVAAVLSGIVDTPGQGRSSLGALGAVLVCSSCCPAACAALRRAKALTLKYASTASFISHIAI